MTEHVEVAIVGGGQSGLVAGYYLQRAGIPYVIVDAGPEAGYSWRRRWDSLELFTIARYCELPGMRFPGGWNRFPDKDELADYLEMYHRTFRQPVRWNTKVDVVERSKDGGYVLRIEGGDITATQVILATGAYRNTFTPPIAAGLADDVFQVHTGDYRNPSMVPGRKVVVVGAANSGAQIAADLHKTHDVVLAQGSPIPHGPRKFLGIGLHWWGDKLGIIKKPLIGERDRIHKKTILVGKSLKQIAKETGIKLCDRAVACDGHTVTFEDGTSTEVDAVVWATGFRPDFTKWVDIPIFGEDGFPRHDRGVVDEAPGLYFLGMQCQYTYGSGLIWWVKEDAEYLIDKIRVYEAPRVPTARTPLHTVEQTAAAG